MSIAGQPDGEPTRVGTSIGDIPAGMDLFVEHNIPASPINNMEVIFNDPHVQARNMLVEVDQDWCRKTDFIR